MKRYIEKLRRATWSYKQPLTRIPAISGAPVSDLFLWRNSEEWETFFELIDLPALFAVSEGAGGLVTVVLFDSSGQPFREQIVEITPGRRTTLVLSGLIGSASGSVGAFSVFHAYTPQSVQSLGSHLAERGYVSYRYRGALLRGYVHGNLDAIARLPDHSLQLLGGRSFRFRNYILQHALVAQDYYELGIVNPTPKKQTIVCRTLSASGELLGFETADLPSCGSHIFRVAAELAQQRIIISSHLIMARPLVFHIQNQTMDVFHG